MAPRARQQPPRNRLPSLAEVLRRSTKPPVDLYCYYLFLQREGSEDSLDFWLDVQAHENLCRAYFNDVRRSGMLIRDDWPQYDRYARTRGSIYGNVTGIRRGDASSSDYDGERYARADSPPSAFTGSPSADQTSFRDGADDEKRGGGDHLAAPDDADRDAARYQLRTPSPRPAGTPHPAYPMSPTLKALFPHDQDPSSADEKAASRRRKRQSTAQVQPIIHRKDPIRRNDLIASAERLYSMYLMPGADKEIYLPPSLRITEFPLSSSQLPAVSHPDYDREAAAQAQVPDMFHAQKEFVYRSMEGDSFPRFLRAKAFGNLTPVSGIARLVLGLVALWAALATAFAFIFLDAKPKVRRLWVILPFTVAIVNIVAHAYDLDPLMVFMGLSETTPFRTIGIREPYVRKLLFGRALWVTFLSAVLVAVLTVIFWAVPGHRL
ncbi:Rax1p [Rhodotorula paludigena]|uniref:Rax1p n=1 Tax=Rhodotorula paludigena TaxID=86838 RepID=UPI00317DB814